jgi:hypothetical protein
MYKGDVRVFMCFYEYFVLLATFRRIGIGKLDVSGRHILGNDKLTFVDTQMTNGMQHTVF